MPHVGRPYPFHPTYWATECCFWPYFAAWKTWLNAWAPNLPPWDGAPYGTFLVSDAGITTSDAKLILWHFQYFDGTYTWSFDVTLQANKMATPWHSEWNITEERDGIPWAHAVKHGDYPSPDAGNINWDEATDLQTGLPCGLPAIQIEPADYSLAGEPFPHHTGGG